MICPKVTIAPGCGTNYPRGFERGREGRCHTDQMAGWDHHLARIADGLGDRLSFDCDQAARQVIPSRFSASSVNSTFARSASLTAPITLDGPAGFAAGLAFDEAG